MTTILTLLEFPPAHQRTEPVYSTIFAAFAVIALPFIVVLIGAAYG